MAALPVCGCGERSLALHIHELNQLSAVHSQLAFRRCCAATRWAEAMSAARPFDNQDHLLTTASEIWRGLSQDDRLEAFSGHPRIGDLESLRDKFPSTKSWSEDEQAGAARASEEILNRLAEGNRRYEERFGYLFIVCASGKSASAMLALLEERLSNHPREESAIAAAEQEKITRLRLLKLLDSGENPS